MRWQADRLEVAWTSDRLYAAADGRDTCSRGNSLKGQYHGRQVKDRQTKARQL